MYPFVKLEVGRNYGLFVHISYIYSDVVTLEINCMLKFILGVELVGRE